MQNIKSEELMAAIHNLSDTEDREAILQMLEEAEGEVTPAIGEKIEAAFHKEIQHLKQFNQELEAAVEDVEQNRSEYTAERADLLKQAEDDLQAMDTDLDKLEAMEEEVEEIEEGEDISDLKSKLD